MRAVWFLVWFPPLLLAACAGEGAIRGRLHYGLDGAAASPRLTWPQPPEVPRYAYAGALVGEPNFEQPASGGGLRAFGRWLAGLDGPGEAPTVLQRPGVVTGDEAGRLYVGDASRQAVFVFDEAVGELHVWERAESARRFQSPAGLAAAGERVFVADAELGAVFVLDRRGEPRGVIGRGHLKRPTGLARDPSTGLLYVADTYAHDVKVFDDAGALVRTIGRRGDGAGEFNYPTHLAFARGELYVCDSMNQRVQVIGPEGARRRIGARGLYLGNLVRPKGVAVDGEGNVYIVESYYDTLLVFSAGGEFLLPIGGTGPQAGRFYLPAGVWVDARNRVHVADQFNGRVVRLQFLGGS